MSSESRFLQSRHVYHQSNPREQVGSLIPRVRDVAAEGVIAGPGEVGTRDGQTWASKSLP